jgi:protein-disulfide isomerase
MNKNVMLVVVIVGLLALVAFGAIRRSGGGAATEPVALEGLDDPQQLVSLAQGITRGEDDAPVTIVEFADFQCPACGSFAGQAKPQVELAYVQTGQAKFVFYDFPLVAIHPHAFLAARAARCANDQGRFWEYHDALFRYQARWASSASPPVSSFEDYAAELELDEGQFRGCLRSDEHADVVTANLRLGEELGVTGTPSIMINSGGMTRMSPGFDFGSIRTLMEQATGGATETGGGRP